MSSKKATSVPGLLTGGIADRAVELAAAMRAGEKRKRRTHPYTGELGGPPCTSNDEWVRRYLLLFEHFGLQPWDWPALAVALAATHVPGLKAAEPVKRGRPRKDRRVQVTDLGLTGAPTLAAFGSGLLGLHFAAKSKGGRPIRWTRELRAELMESADEWQHQQKAARRRASDRGFVLWLCEQHASRTGERKSEVVKRESRALANALSRARRTVSKP